MKTGIIGLGLIGASLARAIKERGVDQVAGFDIQPWVMKKAKLLSIIDNELALDNIGSCDMLLLAIYPAEAIRFLRNHADKIAPGTIVVDCCGIKQGICAEAAAISAGKAWHFVGGHPMAGREASGFDSSTDNLFEGASMILTPPADVSIMTLNRLKEFFLGIGFARIKISDPEKHDRIIAYTSQLAHVLSSAYIKSGAALEHTGFSAGSFKDMTRVATMQPDMWTELCMENREPLIDEISGLISRLSEYRDALQQKDIKGLEQLFAEGRDRKAEVDNLEREALAVLETNKSWK